MSWEDYVDEGGNRYGYQDGYIDDVSGYTTTGVDPDATMGSGDIDLG